MPLPRERDVPADDGGVVPGEQVHAAHLAPLLAQPLHDRAPDEAVCAGDEEARHRNTGASA